MTRQSRLVHSSLFAAVALVASTMIVGGASASTKSLSPEGGGVPTTKTDPSKFKNCQAPPADSLWETAKPEEVGLDAKALQEAADYYTHHLQATMRVYRFGCLVQTSALDPVHERLLTHMYSTTKPISTLVLGHAVLEGKISVDDTVGKYFPNMGDEAHRAITIKQLLTHTSGILKNWPTDINTEIPDNVKHFFNLPIVHPPGTWYEYSQISPNMMNAITEKAVGEDFQTYAQRVLFDKVGILPGTWVWKKDRAGHTYGFSELYMRPIDMIRIGQLIINGGVYRGERVVSEQWIKDMGTGTAQNPGFGYNTWVNAAPWYWTIAINNRQKRDRPLIASAPHDLTYTWGWRGRHIFTMPNLGLTVTTTPLALMVPLPGQIFDGYNGHDPSYDHVDAHQIAQGEQREGYHDFFRILMRAVKDQAIPDPGPWDQPEDNTFDSSMFIGHGQLTLDETDPTNTEYGGWSWFAGVPSAYAKAFATK